MFNQISRRRIFRTNNKIKYYFNVSEEKAWKEAIDRREEMGGKRGMAKLNFVCEFARNSAPSWRIDARFCMVGTNVIYFSETKFFELTLFGWHEVNLHLPMFLRPETSNLVIQMQPTWKKGFLGTKTFWNDNFCFVWFYKSR